MEEVIKKLQDSVVAELKDKETKLSDLKDNLLSLNELITINKSSREGLSSKYMNLKVIKGGNLPSLFAILTLDAQDGKTYNVKVTEIQSMQWVENEDAVIVHFLGIMEEVPQQEISEEVTEKE